MITIKTEAEIEKMYVSGQMLGKVLAALRKEIHEGVTTLQLDRMAEDMIRSMGAVPSFKDYHGFPYTICASLNETVVHGFANDKPLESGQLLRAGVRWLAGGQRVFRGNRRSIQRSAKADGRYGRVLLESG